MIQETIVTTQNLEGKTHLAPMGIHIEKDEFIILPFRPSTTLDNLLSTRKAVINYCDDVRVFAGCLTGHRDWPLHSATKIQGSVLDNALAHCEVEITHIEEDAIRPKIICKAIHHEQHKAFTGFNRAQFSVLEATILLSRVTRLLPEKIQTELEYLRIGFDKTAGEREQEAWDWVMSAIQAHLTQGSTHE